MLTQTVAGDAQTCVVAAPPVQQQIDAAVGQRDDDLLEHRAQDALARLGVHAGMVPGDRQVLAQRHQAGSLVGRQRLRIPGLVHQFFLPPHIVEALVPSPFEFRGHQAVVGVDGVVLAPREFGFVVRLRQRQLPLALRFAVVGLPPLDRASAASTPSGLSSRSTSSATAASTRTPPKAMHGRVPWLMCAPRQP